MWNPFRKKAKQQISDSSAPNRVDELANTLQRNGQIENLDQELQKLDQTKLNDIELESWWHLFGIAAFRAGRQQEATLRFEEAHRRFPKSAQIKFSLGQQYVNSHQIDHGFDLFKSCVFPEIPRDYVMAQVRYAYLWNRYEDGRFMLRPFFAAYQELKILDDHFLYIRGLPFFGSWWSYLAALSVLSKDTQELESVTAYVSQNCHDYDFDYLKAELLSARNEQPQVMLPFIEKRIENAQPGFPNGYSLMMLAILKGRTATSQSEAVNLLDIVELGENDFPWLADIRTLAKAEIAQRFSLPDIEQLHVEEFMAQQPMLFEPDIALNFHLLRYQERLKPRFQTK